MAVREGTEYTDYFSMSSMLMKPGENGHVYTALGGDDVVEGSSYTDFIFGGDGNDTLSGFGGDDTIHGGLGNDRLSGGLGVDYVVGEGGNDFLKGDEGADFLYGGAGNDVYQHIVGYGSIDTINEAGWGRGGGIDTVILADIYGADVGFQQSGNDLLLSDNYDFSNGFSEGVVIKNFFLGGDNVVEYVIAGADNIRYDLTFLIG